MSDKWQVGVLGLGHAGLPTAVGLAELGWPVIGTDCAARHQADTQNEGQRAEVGAHTSPLGMR